jgi:hypothetical protein
VLIKDKAKIALPKSASLFLNKLRTSEAKSVIPRFKILENEKSTEGNNFINFFDFTLKSFT